MTTQSIPSQDLVNAARELLRFKDIKDRAEKFGSGNVDHREWADYCENKERAWQALRDAVQNEASNEALKPAAQAKPSLICNECGRIVPPAGFERQNGSVCSEGYPDTGTGAVRLCMGTMVPVKNDPPVEDRSGTRWRHKKRGTVYTEVGLAQLQVSDNVHLRDGTAMIIYRGEDGYLWVRSSAEFKDGRFERIRQGPSQEPKS